ncbi:MULTISPECIES: carbamoyltransferase C-terminal domain-containing protein [unclassified Ruegeria]|uniref:carbamoyltransferase C-terminal domain-containing protein n=1 Tax=unclassified Ruegeria TaxID=2625375 RepID=UPI001489371B|nr:MULTISPECIES: carbamoyltransferase C-terminal domain-containing protein [unclassified Ruegeria]
MKIFSINPGHDGSIAGVDANGQRLLFSYEAEKDSFPRNAPVNADTLINAALWFDQLPDVLALSGWSAIEVGHAPRSGAGYFGVGDGSEIIGKKRFFGKSLDFYSSTHERSHIWSTYAMSPFQQGEPCYVLVWEGVLGDFYEIDTGLNIHHLGQVMANPGKMFSFLHTLADPDALRADGAGRKSDAGKLMAVSALGDAAKADQEADDLVEALLNGKIANTPLLKDDFKSSSFHNIGVGTQRFRNLAAKYSDRIFSIFHDFAKTHLTKGFPLLIAGGCGLNCDWNTRWRDCGLFRDVFVPPCTNDSGSAIGTAVDAMRHFTGQAKLDWRVYSGPPFCDDQIDMDEVSVSELNLKEVATALNDGMIIGWALGNCEIGPRALGNRSILAAPFSTDTRDRLNILKGRAPDAPIAPVCLEEDVSEHFDWSGSSPYMLHFAKVKDPRLKAVAHLDGSARLQTVRQDQNAMLYNLLTEFKAQSGVGVLCNTSLNFQGAGFINNTSDLYHYAQSAGLDGVVAGLSLYRFRR